MDIHQTEEEQVEQIKKIWQEYGNAIITGLVLGLGGFIAYGYYNQNKLAEEMTTSDGYQQVLELAGEGDESFQNKGNEFIKANPESNYAGLTALALAKDSAEHKDWAQVEKYLNTAIEKTNDKGIKALATLRLAKVQVQTEQYDAAIATLSATLPESYKASIEEIKGDAYLKQGNQDKARAAYQAAIDASGQAGNPVLQMKLDDLAETVVLTK
ncbi:YfgM family protein [Thalassotalea marina]|uniref:Ancillary SecYEG translocon subunit n=1 Tax=Thalassotalea marina TaxID=1673741 RepID=A0A919EHL0_9GAMM|nr:tetratricopeptide repeat protein [Thalassotalea marina]GHF84194.1 hypothetical protein GCM10017161_09480 [Thalassotalea marina]